MMDNKYPNKDELEKKRDYLVGTLDDWFNLSAQLGRSDQEDLALQACLHGLAQQAGGAFLIEEEDRIALSWPNGLVPNSDLLAHALQFSGAVSSRYTEALLELSGFTVANDSEGRKGWSWRSYNFTMEALAGMKGERRLEALALGQAYIDEGGTDERVVSKYAQLLYGDGQIFKARTVVEDWLSRHPETDAPQLITFLLNRFDFEPNKVVELATRGIASLAMDQPTASLSNLVCQRGFAYDRLAHAQAFAGNKSQVCALISKAIDEFDAAMRLNLQPVQQEPVHQRRIVLAALAKENGCNSELAGSSASVPDREKAEQAAMRLSVALKNGVPGVALLNEVQDVLDSADEQTKKVILRLISHVSSDEENDAELRVNAQFLKENLADFSN